MQVEHIINDGIIGFYTTVKATTFYCHDKHSGKTINLLTIWKLIDEPIQDNHTDKFGTLVNEIVWGKHTYYFDKSLLKEKLDAILSTKVLVEGPHNLLFDELTTKRPNFQFISCVSQNRIRYIFEGCDNNYVYEYFDVSQGLLQDVLISEEVLQLIISKMSESSVRIHKCPEVLGNLYIQVPANLISSTFTRPTDFTIKIEWNLKMQRRPDCNILQVIESKYGDNQYMISKLEEDDIIRFRSKHENITAIIQRKDGLNIFSNHTCPIIGLIITSSQSANQKRVFTDSVFPELDIQTFRGTGATWKNPIEDIIHITQVGLEAKQLEAERKFAQYPESLTGADTFESPKELIKKLIQLYGQRGFIMWDPYIQSEEIIEYVVSSYEFDSKIKVLTSKKVFVAPDKSKTFNLFGYKITVSKTNKFNTREYFFEKCKAEIKRVSNEEGLNLEVRCSWGLTGNSFHDRFIIFPETGQHKECMAWSLGTSFNQLGQDHHIILKVDNADKILRSFNKVWDRLDSSHVIYNRTNT